MYWNLALSPDMWAHPASCGCCAAGEILPPVSSLRKIGSRYRCFLGEGYTLGDSNGSMMLQELDNFFVGHSDLRLPDPHGIRFILAPAPAVRSSLPWHARPGQERFGCRPGGPHEIFDTYLA